MSATIERSSTTTNERRSDENGDGEFPILLELVIDDREVIRALAEYAEGDARNQYAAEALKIGVVALRHVGGMVTADQFRRDGDRLLNDMAKALEHHQQSVPVQIESKLKEYFDPKDGRFTDRVQRLVSNDGELSTLIKGLVVGENSELARTMLAQIAPLMKHLDPEQSEGLLAMLRTSFQGQFEIVLKEFSLDHKDGALCRLVAELTGKHGDLSKDLQSKIDVIIKEFSLNEENSALSRLVHNVTQAQRTITNEFSLDSETSCLSRLKRELTTILAAHVQTSAEFQDEVKGALRELSVRRDEQSRSTEHGKSFQQVLFEYLQCRSTAYGDITEFVGDNVGVITSCKKGDVVVQLGQDTIAPGAKIVFEAKEEEKYPLSKAIAEIEKARNNRQAQVGVFVYSTKTAPDKLPSLGRYGNDIVVVWDAEDPLTDSFLWAALEFARLSCIYTRLAEDVHASDFEDIGKLISNIQKRAGNLDNIRRYAETAQTSAKTIQSATGKILKRVGLDRKALDRQVALLRKRLDELRQSTTTSS